MKERKTALWEKCRIHLSLWFGKSSEKGCGAFHQKLSQTCLTSVLFCLEFNEKVHTAKESAEKVLFQPTKVVFCIVSSLKRLMKRVTSWNNFLNLRDLPLWVGVFMKWGSIYSAFLQSFWPWSHWKRKMMVLLIHCRFHKCIWTLRFF